MSPANGQVPARILVIDDEVQPRRFLPIALRSQGYEVMEGDRGGGPGPGGH
jgi:two-component system, OmpR family, KDP operon response regulator KdpE